METFFGLDLVSFVAGAAAMLVMAFIMGLLALSWDRWTQAIEDRDDQPTGPTQQWEFIEEKS